MFNFVDNTITLIKTFNTFCDTLPTEVDQCNIQILTVRVKSTKIYTNPRQDIKKTRYTSMSRCPGPTRGSRRGAYGPWNGTSSGQSANERH